MKTALWRLNLTGCKKVGRGAMKGKYPVASKEPDLIEDQGKVMLLVRVDSNEVSRRKPNHDLVQTLLLGTYGHP
jgi:hypothetical protein